MGTGLLYNIQVECRANVLNFSGAVYKSFKTKQEADSFIDMNKGGGIATSGVEKKTKATRNHATETQCGSSNAQRTTEIYTDGSCLGNGRIGSRAGVGVFFGDKDSR